jgi:hypothetical protein
MTDAREALAELDTDIETLPRADGDPFLEELRAHLAAKRILLHERIAGLAST